MQKYSKNIKIYFQQQLNVALKMYKRTFTFDGTWGVISTHCNNSEEDFFRTHIENNNFDVCKIWKIELSRHVNISRYPFICCSWKISNWAEWAHSKRWLLCRQSTWGLKYALHLYQKKLLSISLIFLFFNNILYERKVNNFLTMFVVFILCSTRRNNKPNN